MRGKTSIVVALGFILFGSLLPPSSKAQNIHPRESAVSAHDCDRKCLYGFVDAYLDALAAKDPSRVPWAKRVQFTENNVSLQIGDGLWGTISGRTAYDLRVADPSSGEVAFFGVVEEHGVP